MPKTVSERTRERVATGAALFHIVNKDWPNKIKLTRLDIADEEICMMGQLYDWYDFDTIIGLLKEAGTEFCRAHGLDMGHPWGEAPALGFAQEDSNLDWEKEEAPELTRAWKDLIRKRRAEEKARATAVAAVPPGV